MTAETDAFVTLPTRWSVDEQDGTRSYPDEPTELIAAGTYLIGQTEDADPEEATTVVLRAEVAIDGDGALGVGNRDVVQAIADRLNASRREAVVDVDAVTIARAVLGEDETVELVARRFHRQVDPMTPSLLEKGEETREAYRSAARRALIYVLREAST